MLWYFKTQGANRPGRQAARGFSADGFHGADVIAAKLDSTDDRSPQLTRAIRFTPGPIQHGMPPNNIAVSLVVATRVEATDTHPENRPYSRIAVATSLFGQQLVSAHPDGDWYDPKAQTPVTFDIDATDSPGLILSYQVPRSIDDQIRCNTTATPPNALTHTGEPVGRNTYGLLQPAPAIVTAVEIIGRESRRWRDGRGTLNPPEIHVYLTRTDPEAVAVLIRKHYWWRGAAPLIAQKTGLPVRTVSRILSGKQPSPQTAARLWEFAHQQRLFEKP